MTEAIPFIVGYVLLGAAVLAWTDPGLKNTLEFLSVISSEADFDVPKSVMALVGAVAVTFVVVTWPYTLGKNIAKRARK